MAQGEFRSTVTGTLALSLCGDDGLRFGNDHFVPDATRGYFQFQMCYALPEESIYGQAFHPAVLAKSYRSLLNQNVNYQHQIGQYYQGQDVRDRIIGAVVAVDFPREPAGGWQVNPDRAQTPSISGVGVIFKQAQGMTKVLGEHLTSRHRYTVSMEVFYPLLPGDDTENPNNHAGFAVSLEGRPPQFNFTPPDLLRAGYEYVPANHAPPELVAAFNRKKQPPRVIARYQGRKVTVLMGGLNNPVHIAGVGIVRHGAEPPAKILRLSASAEHPLESLAEKMRAEFSAIN